MSKIAVADAARRLTPLVRDGLLIVACIASQALYLLTAYLRYGYFTFPLDDAWIYQVYARNLAASGQWAFIPGVPSTGSTSILWTLLIAPGYLLHINPLWWTHLLGLASLIALVLGGARLFGEDSLARSLVVGLALALEWHLVWATASGMETGIFAAALIWFWVWLRRHDPHSSGHSLKDGLLLGMWGGGLMLIRPEGILAFGIAGLYGVLLCPAKVSWRLRWSLLAGAGFAMFVVPFFLFNYHASGAIWPNTFYAKQTEYASLWSRPYPLRLVDQMSMGLIGAQILLIPGLLADVWRRARSRPVEWVSLLPWGWAFLHWALYAARLPVTYQYGRYAIPVMPLIVIYGVRGLVELVRPRARRRMVRLGSLAWMLAAALLFPAFLGWFGAPAYARDVSFIEMEMGASARWLAAHTHNDDVIAAHDIGALGYYAPRPLVDLAGLISPDVVPFMNDDQHIARYIIDSQAAFLVIFPNWSPAYARLASDPRFCPIWSAAESPNYVSYSELGAMTIYKVQPDGKCADNSP